MDPSVPEDYKQVAGAAMVLGAEETVMQPLAGLAKVRVLLPGGIKPEELVAFGRFPNTRDPQPMECPVKDAAEPGDCRRRLSMLSLCDPQESAVNDSSVHSDQHGEYEDSSCGSIVNKRVADTSLETPRLKRRRGRQPKLSSSSSPSPATPVPVPVPPCLPTSLKTSPASVLTPSTKVAKRQGRKSRAEPPSPSASVPGLLHPGLSAALASRPCATSLLTPPVNVAKKRGRRSKSELLSPATPVSVVLTPCLSPSQENSASTQLTLPIKLPKKRQRKSNTEFSSVVTPVSVELTQFLPASMDKSSPTASPRTPSVKIPKKQRGKFKAKLLSPNFPPSPTTPASVLLPSCPPSPVKSPQATSLLTPPVRKRGRKTKAELLILRLAEEAQENQAPVNTFVLREEDECTETTPGGRPRRRAAKVALRYLHDLADQLSSSGLSSPTKPSEPEEGSVKKKRRKRKRDEDEEDSDFVVSEDVLRSVEKEEEEEEAECERLSDVSDGDLRSHRRASSPSEFSPKSSPQNKGQAANGFQNSIMAPVWRAAEITNSFRDVNYSSWEFPDWIPSVESWKFLSLREAEAYMPLLATSPPFTIHREGIQGCAVKHTLNSCGTEAAFSYGLATDHGCIWDLKFCPSGGWELPGTSRKSSHMSRLGLLAAAFSSGHVEIYSLPHPESLYSYRSTQVKDPESRGHSICRVDCVVRLQVGSIKACDPEESGQCFTVAWHPTKPHQYLAAGFYNGTVSIWDLKTKSVLQRVRQGRVIKQYPFHSFFAHDHAVRCIEWCKADSNFLVTSGNDRRLKFWDFRRLYEPINNIKRYHSTEISWLLPYCGVTVAQDNCYASFGLCGIHYVDSGFLECKPYFMAPRKGTVWSISGSDWLSTVTAGDMNGEVMVVVLPNVNVNYLNMKKPSERRFPIYKADFVPRAPDSPESPHHGTEMPDGSLADSSEWEHFKPKSFRAAIGRFSLMFSDMNLRHFQRLPNRELVKRMKINETKRDVNMERVQLESIHKVRFNPNLDSYAWVASGGHSGLVRVHCLQGLVSPAGCKLIEEKRAQFRAMYEETYTVGESEYSPEVHHCVVQV
ncbi:general transcription factor 3C polypeptide 2 [Bombina bombina]|uniref:general transcription factor 3C polypeptide 2 n=1 Tax=Bombina bombina TaxID=8345 RepID=UPI00235B00CC|nr:general transcription factor 3C polypeptide 2 [Bombina bombina]